MDLSGAAPQKPIVERAKAIIVTPKEEWPVIAAETTSQGDILKGYVLPLAAIGPVAGFIGGQLFGYNAIFVSFKPTLLMGLTTAIVGYVLGIAWVFIMAFIVSALAPKFGGQENRLNAFKLAAYSYTAAWLVGIFGLIPSLGFFGLLGLYSIYLFYTGAEPLMKVPQDKTVGYMVVTALCAVVLFIVAAPITAAITGLFGASPLASSSSDEVSSSVTIPGAGTVDLGKMQQATKQMEDAANGKAPPVEPAKLSALLPAAIGGYQRTALESTAMGPMGASAQGTYTSASGDKSFTLQIADMSALGGLAALGSAMGVQQSREDANGFQRTQTVDGQMQTEEWNVAGSSGKFGRMVANRFMVEANGNVGSIDELKSAVATIDPDDLTDLVD